MAQASIERVFHAPFDRVWEVLTDYELYPKFLKSLETIKLINRKKNKVQVQYEIYLIKKVSYILELHEKKKEKTLRWKLVSSSWMKKNEGAWILKSSGRGKTKATYTLDIEFAFSVPKFILKKLVAWNFPQMMDQFQKRIESLKE